MSPASLPYSLPHSRGRTVLVAAAVLGLLVLSAWSWWVLPQRSLLARLQVGKGTAFIQEGPGLTAGWRLELELDPTLRPMPAWILREGSADSAVYELRFLPGEGLMQILRVPSFRGLGHVPVLLAALRLATVPVSVRWLRRAGWQELEVDGHLLVAVDPDPLSASGRWSLETEADLGRSHLAIHREEIPVRRDDPAQAVEAREAQRILYATGDAAHGSGQEAARAAGAAVAALGAGHPLRQSLNAWLALRIAGDDLRPFWVEPASVQRVRSAVVHLLGRSDQDGHAGAMAALLAPLSETAVQVPGEVVPARAWIEHRRRYLSLVAEIAADLALRDTVFAETERRELALAAQTARRLSGQPCAPVPADAPPWQAMRWRLVADVPLMDAGNGTPVTLPALPEAWRSRPLVRGALERLMAAVRLDAPAAFGTCARLRQALADHKPETIREVMKTLPARDAVITTALLALAGVFTTAEAQTALAGGNPAWTDSDPLAFALSRLMRKRTTEAPVEVPLPSTLAAYADLLAGSLRSTTLVFVPGPANLPPSQLLVAALAMQEVAGKDLDPDWSLLDGAPSAVLPLELAKPRPLAPPPQPKPPADPPPTESTEAPIP